MLTTAWGDETYITKEAQMNENEISRLNKMVNKVVANQMRVSNLKTTYNKTNFRWFTDELMETLKDKDQQLTVITALCGVKPDGTTPKDFRFYKEALITLKVEDSSHRSQTN